MQTQAKLQTEGSSLTSSRSEDFTEHVRRRQTLEDVPRKTLASIPTWRNRRLCHVPASRSNKCLELKKPPSRSTEQHGKQQSGQQTPEEEDSTIPLRYTERGCERGGPTCACHSRVFGCARMWVIVTVKLLGGISFSFHSKVLVILCTCISYHHKYLNLRKPRFQVRLRSTDCCI